MGNTKKKEKKKEEFSLLFNSAINWRITELVRGNFYLSQSTINATVQPPHIKVLSLTRLITSNSTMDNSSHSASSDCNSQTGGGVGRFRYRKQTRSHPYRP